MALEDFFTLSEMNNGLAAPERVKELVGLMHKGTDCVINNISDATRQWSAVASAIAGTENTDCLLLFVELDGLMYMNKWLKDAADFVNKSSDSCVEDAIIDLLRALKRIEPDSDKFVTSGISMTVKDLGHNNPKVRDMAKSLMEMWNKEKPKQLVMIGEGIGMPGNEESRVSERHAGENGNLGPSNEDIDASQGSLTSEIRSEIAKGDLLSTASESLKDEVIKKTSSEGVISDEDIPYPTNTKSFPDPVNENIDKVEPPVSCSEENPSTEACSVAGAEEGAQTQEINGSELDPTSTEKVTQILDSSPQICDKEQDPKGTLSTNDTETLHAVTEPSDIKNDNGDGSEEKVCIGEISNCLNTVATEADEKMNDDNSSGSDRNIMAYRVKSGGEHDSNMLQASNTSELKPKHFKGSGGLFQRTGNLRIDEGRIYDKVEGCLDKGYDLTKQKKRREVRSIETRSDFDLDFGIADPLELARLVAIEVEREVEDRNELSCSASDQEMSSRVQRLESSHSITGEQCQAESSDAEVPSQRDISLDSPTREDHATSVQSLDPDSQEARSPQVTEAAQVVEASIDEGICHFDLNQDVCLEDMEHQGDTMSPPVSIVSASRAAAAPLMPVGPLQFEGSLGWKGSAATSAFRPASSRRVPDSNYALSAGGSNSSSKENHSFLNIDLNLAGNGDDKQIPSFFQLASLESSAEASSRRSERLEFDLNQISDDGAPLDMQPEQDLFHQRNGHHNQSSSSSSSKQTSIRNIDLNDQPTVANDLSSSRFYLNPSQSFIASGSVKSDDSVISIMGRRVEVNRRDSSAKHVPLSNGRIPEPTIGFNLERPVNLAMGYSSPYPHPHIFGLNGLPPGSSIPFYGSGGAIPYMVDSRGAPVVPQIMPSSAISTAFPQPPYLFSMPGMPNANSVGVSRDNFDLNSGMYTEGSGRDLGGFRQLFSPPQPRPFVEHLKVNAQPSTSSGIGALGKRKEPENGWESYPFKHHHQPWR